MWGGASGRAFLLLAQDRHVLCTRDAFVLTNNKALDHIGGVEEAAC